MLIYLLVTTTPVRRLLVLVLLEATRRGLRFSLCSALRPARAKGEKGARVKMVAKAALMS
jgi:hypothetical protein